MGMINNFKKIMEANKIAQTPLTESEKKTSIIRAPSYVEEHNMFKDPRLPDWHNAEDVIKKLGAMLATGATLGMVGGFGKFGKSGIPEEPIKPIDFELSQSPKEAAKTDAQVRFEQFLEDVKKRHNVQEEPIELDFLKSENQSIKPEPKPPENPNEQWHDENPRWKKK